MSKIGLFSGSFNPIHLGHAHLAQYVLEHTDLEQVWFVVSPCNPLKQNSELIDETQRLRMVELAIAGNQNLHASDFEFHLPKPSYSINTLRAISEEYPQHDFSLIIGEDNWTLFDKWKDYAQILAAFSLVVYPRNENVEEFQAVSHSYLNKYSAGQQVKSVSFVNAPLFPISSTQVRTMVKQQEDVNEWIHPDVAQYIVQNNLYK